MTEAAGAHGLSLNQRRIRASRIEAAEEAVAILERDGWDALGVTELAAAAGLSTRTFHRYFPAKRDVFRPLLAEAGLRSRAVFAAAPESDFAQLCADALVAGVLAFPGGLAGAHRAYRILLTTPELRPVWLDEAFSFERAFSPYLPVELLSAASIPLAHTVDARRLLGALVFSAMRVAIEEWADGSDPDALHDMTVHAVSLAINR